MRKPLKILLLVLAAAFLAAAGVVARLYWASLDPAHALNVKLEGAVIDWNFRDAGQSFNDCVGAPRLRPGRLFRAAVWFSGWSCDAVGGPDVVYTLNFKPLDPGRREYFCRSGDGNRIGRHFNTRVELNDLEFRKTWDDPAQREDACGFFRDSFAELAKGARVLIHCDAGRDRTGTYNALVEALISEAQGPLDAATLAAVECDYRKSASLVPQKYGRMQAFLQDIAAHEGSVRAFLAAQCALPAETLDTVVRALSWPPGQTAVK